MRRRHKRQTKKLIFAVLVLFVLLSVAYTYAIKNPAIINKIPKVTGKYPEPAATPVITTTTPDSTIKVAAFNIQVFDTTKAGNPEIMETLSKIIRNYDIIAVQEIRDTSQTALPALESAVNAMGGPQYDSIVSERLGRTTSKEQYAYIYNTQTIQQIGTPYTYPDPSDIFHREPYIVENTHCGNCDVSIEEVDAGIEKAISFLGEHQLPSGGFQSYISKNPDLTDGAYLPLIFETTFVLHALNFVDSDSGAHEIKNKTAGFLLANVEEPGVWR